MERKDNPTDFFILAFVLGISAVIALAFIVKDGWQSCQASYVKKGLSPKAAKAKCEKDLREVAKDAYNISRFSRSLDPLDLMD